MQRSEDDIIQDHQQDYDRHALHQPYKETGDPVGNAIASTACHEDAKSKQGAGKDRHDRKDQSSQYTGQKEFPAALADEGSLETGFYS